MASSAKQTVQKKSSGWGSLLSGAVAGLESRLDTILADDNDASARQRAAEEVAKQAQASRQRESSGNLAPPAVDGKRGSREPSRTRVNDRLAERLAKAAAAKTPSQAGSAAPSRVGTPVTAEVRSGEEQRGSADIARSVPGVEHLAESAGDDGVTSEKADEKADPMEDVSLPAPSSPTGQERVSADSSRPSGELARNEASSRASSELRNGTSQRVASDLAEEVARSREAHAQAEKQRAEEMQAYMEKIDALQSKLQYLAKETVAAAKEANASSEVGSEKKMAEKDERIALLMEEGEKLSKSEMKHLQTIKKLRSKTAEDDKAAIELRKRLDRAERSETALQQRLRAAESASRQAEQKTEAQIAKISNQVEELRVDRENASDLVRTLTAQLREAREMAERAEKDAAANLREGSEVYKGRIAALENDVEDARIEKKLAEDRAASEARKAKEELEGARQRFGVRVLEFKNEISGLESRVEAMRTRAEEASADGGNFGGTGEGNVKLLRQVETLQSQYSLAKENWETIESSLNTRLATLEKERDEAVRRENEVRKRARDVGTKSRKAEEALESSVEQARGLTKELDIQREETKSLQSRLEAAESEMKSAKVDLDRQRKLWETEFDQRLEEEKVRWQRALPVQNGSPATYSRKQSNTDMSTLHSSRRPPPNRLTARDLADLHTEHQRPSSSGRRSSAFPNVATPSTRPHPAPFFPAPNPNPGSNDASPALSRQESMLSLEPASGIPPTPEVDDHEFEPSASPDRTINDLLSTSTSAAGPSVQLVERMSAAVRRLESEKAALKDEMRRLSSQRDSARDEVVGLMREVETKQAKDAEAGRLDKELERMKGRYEACLDVLGEREEQVEELRADVVELKRIYRELVESKVGGGTGTA